MIVSRDLDCTNTLYIQFSFKFITKGTFYLHNVCNYCAVTAEREFILWTFQVSRSVPTQCCCSTLWMGESVGCCWMSFTFQHPLTLCSCTCPCLPVLRPTPRALDSGNLTTAVSNLSPCSGWCFFILTYTGILTTHFYSQCEKSQRYLSPSGKKEEVWVIDDLIIDGSSLHNPPVVIDSFEEGPNDSNWLFFPGGNTGLYCPYQKTGL